MKLIVLAAAIQASIVSAKDSSSSSSSSLDPYVPIETACPTDLQFVRKASSLSPGETSFLQKRDKYTQQALIDWLSKSNLTDFDASQFLSNQTVRIGLAYSGGGYRAMLCGAGQLAALDNRTTGADGEGHLGGLFQASTYLAGLSGGNWLVGSIAVNNFTSVEAIQNSDNLWNLKHSLVAPGGINVIKTFSYWDDIIDNVQAKKRAGWNTSLTDLWGRGLSYQLFNASKGGPGLHYSDVRDNDQFKNGEVPFPIHVADRRNIGETIIGLNSSVFEFNPYELGSWDPNTYQFADLRYIGTDADNGSPINNNSCVVGYDNVGFMVGTSATLFNQFILRINGTGVSGRVYDLAHSILNDLSEANDDISIFRPNPFYNIKGFVDSDHDTLTLVDGGEDNMNVPIYPLYQPQRNVDIIFAFDNSADTQYSWPDGASLVATYERQFGPQGNGTHFPYVPDTNTFIEKGLVDQPTFFGCNVTNLTSLFVNDTNNSLGNSTHDGVNIPPVVVYIGNSFHSYSSNVSTFDLKYDTDERDAVIQNGYNVMSQNNGTIDSEWRACVGCAIVLREQQRRGQSPTEQCQRCFTKYCWDGSLAASQDGNTTSLGSRRDGNSNYVSNSTAASASASATATKKKKNAASTVKTGVFAAVLAVVAQFI